MVCHIFYIINLYPIFWMLFCTFSRHNKHINYVLIELSQVRKGSIESKMLLRGTKRSTVAWVQNDRKIASTKWLGYKSTRFPLVYWRCQSYMATEFLERSSRRRKMMFDVRWWCNNMSFVWEDDDALNHVWENIYSQFIIFTIICSSISLLLPCFNFTITHCITTIILLFTFIIILLILVIIIQLSYVML